MRFCYFLLLISLLTSACETVVEIDLPDEGNRIVVNGLVPSDSSWIMRITQSKDPLESVDFFTSIFTPIKNAEVVITDNEGNIINLTYSEDIPEFVDCEFENCDAYGYFVNPSAAKAGMALSNVGVSPYDALKMATISAASAMGKEKIFGSIAIGKRADLLLLDENPLESIYHLSKRKGMMVRGIWLSEDELVQIRNKIKKVFGNN